MREWFEKITKRQHALHEKFLSFLGAVQGAVRCCPTTIKIMNYLQETTHELLALLMTDELTTSQTTWCYDDY